MPALAIADRAVTSSPTAPTTATFTVTLSAASSQTVTVAYVTADGTAQAGVDYVAVPPSMLTFAPGTTQQTINITVDAEPAGAGVKSFTVNLLNPTGATIGGATAIGTINPRSHPPCRCRGHGNRQSPVARSRRCSSSLCPPRPVRR